MNAHLLRLAPLLHLVAVASSAQEAHGPYAIGVNVQVSASQSGIPHYETYVAADRKNAGHLIACAYVVRPDHRVDNVFYVSFDGGATWAHTLTVPDATDPSCAIGPGAAFAESIHDLPDKNGTPVLSVYHSGDGGRTWQPSSIDVVAPPIDRAYLTADDTDGVFKRNVYVHAYRYSRNPRPDVVFFPGTDEGAGFHGILLKAPSTFEKPWFFPGNGVVDNEGTFFALLCEIDDTKRNMSYRTDEASAPPAANAVLYVLASHDGGKTLDDPAGKIDGVYYDLRIPQLCLPALAVDRSRGRFRGQLYAVWPDARRDHHTRILFSSSRDHGHTWTPPAPIDDNAVAHSANTRANNFMPAIAVNSRGVVGVSWYDRREATDNLGYRVRFSASLDGGQSWLPSAVVSTAAHVDRGDSRKNSGDTAGLAADRDGVFHPVWIDNRTGLPQMWTATVRVRGRSR